jgi:hypothetical protein
MVIRLVLKINSFAQVPNEDFIKIEGSHGFKQTVIDVKDIQNFWILKHFEKQKPIEDLKPIKV